MKKYSVSNDGSKINEYTLSNDQTGIRKDCDFIVEDQNGRRFNAKSKHYFDNRESAVEDFVKTTEDSKQLYQSIVDNHEAKLLAASNLLQNI